MKNIISPRAILILLLFALTGALAVRYYNSRNELKVKGENWDKLMLILNQLDLNYVDSVDHKDLTERAIPMILESLDPHSVYLPPQDLEKSEEVLEGNFDGIGVEFNVPNDTAVIVNVFKGGPSDKAGLLSGDRIVKVNGELVAGIKMHQDSLIKRLRGRSGSMVDISISRVGVKQLLDFTLKRDKIPVRSVDVAYMVNDSVAYVKLAKFSKNSHKEFVESLNELDMNSLKEIILDLRGNTGGYLEPALLLSNEFLESGKLIVYIEGLRRPRHNFFADNNGNCQQCRVKVLIDENSASSSEIVAGAIQDNDRGTIYGRRSYGKGLVQEPIYFTDNSGIRLTVARYYTPTGRSIQKPFGKDYRLDILERYRHGEMMEADSMRIDTTLRYTTAGGKVVYGGGGIVPDIFVPIDTVGINNCFIKISNLSLPIKFSTKIADEYRDRIKNINDLKSLNTFFDTINYEQKFLDFAAKNGYRPSSGWNECRHIVLTQIKAFVGRYTPMEDKAFYPIISEIDNVFQAAIAQ